jgi:hypothetical protein
MDRKLHPGNFALHNTKTGHLSEVGLTPPYPVPSVMGGAFVSVCLVTVAANLRARHKHLTQARHSVCPTCSKMYVDQLKYLGT